MKKPIVLIIAIFLICCMSGCISVDMPNVIRSSEIMPDQNNSVESAETAFPVVVEKFQDTRLDKKAVGYNIHMGGTSHIVVDRDMSSIFEEIVTRELAAKGIKSGNSIFTLKGSVQGMSIGNIPFNNSLTGEMSVELVINNTKKNAQVWSKTFVGKATGNDYKMVLAQAIKELADLIRKDDSILKVKETYATALLEQPVKSIYSSSKKTTPPKIIITTPNTDHARGIKIVKTDSDFEIRGVIVSEGALNSLSINDKIVVPSADGSFSHIVKIKPGENDFRISARDANGNDSAKTIAISAVTDIAKEQSQAVVVNTSSKPSLWILAIGVSKYQNETLNLAHADNDATAISAAFNKQKGKMFSDVNSKTLVNKDATRGNIISAMSTSLGQAAPGDVVIIYVAGHGIKHSQTGSYYFLPYNADAQNLLYEGLKWSDFEESVKILSSNVDKVILLIDTCHSGSINIAMRDVQAGEDLASSMKSASGTYILAASKSGEASLESPKYNNHGAFTYSLLKGLEGEAYHNQSTYLTVNELFSYVASAVPKITEGQQHPHFQMQGTDLPLVILP